MIINSKYKSIRPVVETLQDVIDSAIASEEFDEDSIELLLDISDKINEMSGETRIKIKNMGQCSRAIC